MKANSLRNFSILLIPFVAFLLGFTIGYQQGQTKQSFAYGWKAPIDKILSQTGTHSGELNLDPLYKVWNLVQTKYIDSDAIDSQAVVYGAIKGLTHSLGDPYTYFMDPKDSREFNQQLNGDMEGIGAEITVKDGMVVIVSPLKNSPAEKAGLKPQDIVVKIDGEVLINPTLVEAVQKIRGKKGTVVTLTIAREKEENPIEVKITRDEIKVPSVEWKVMDKSIAYIAINQFGDTTTEEFSKALDDVLAKPKTGLILDLRMNGGGYLDAAVDIISQFVPSGVATTIEYRDKEDNETKYVTGSPRDASIPIVVLINKGSASASEIVAGALKDQKRAYLIGEKSFGKGSVQELEPLSDGSSLRVTTAKWYTPNHVNIDHNGITPDLVIENAEDSKIGDVQKDLQLKEAMNYLGRR